MAGYSRYYPLTPPRLLDLSKKLAKHVKQLEKYDPLVQEMSEEASLDSDYLAMLVAIENKVEIKDLPEDSELRSLSGCKDNISVAELAGGHRLILKSGEILVPKSLRLQMLKNLHVTHSSDTYMAKGKICWLNMKADIKDYFKKYSECLEFRRSKAQS